MKRKKILILAVVILVAAAIAAGVVWYRRQDVLTVNAEAVRSRDLEAIVSASGTIQPKRQVNISANTMGRVTRLAVQEGQRVKEGQFLLEIDPRSLAGQLDAGQAGVAAARSSLRQSGTLVEQSRASLLLAEQNLKRQRELWEEGLTTKEALDRAQSEFEVRTSELQAREQDVKTREQEVRRQEAALATTRYNLSQIVIQAPMDGLITRRNIEEGENVVVGTMNNPGTVLLTVADMSVIEAEVEVDETDIPNVQMGQRATVTIDAIANREFTGRVTEIGNSPIQVVGQQATGQRQATNFKVAVTINEEVPDVRPGFTCTAEITTATRDNVVAVPIQALTVREMLFDEKGALVHEPPPARRRGTTGVETPVAAAEPPPGHTRNETEGVFVLRDNRAVFTPVTIGIAGERYFEVLSGLRAGDQVITGPFSSVRQLADGEQVKIEERASRP